MPEGTPDGGGLVAVVTDGLTISRLDIYELDTMRRLERRPGWSWPSQIVAAADGRLWFDIPDAVDHLLHELKEFERAAEISIIVPIARGATLALVDESGRLTSHEVQDLSGALRRGGVISYVNAVCSETDAVFDGMADAAERYRLYGLPPNFTSYAVPGRTIVSLAIEFPEQLREAGRLAFGPEAIGRLVCAEAPGAGLSGLEPTYLMCHTGLWKHGQWSDLARSIDAFVKERTGKRLIGGLLAEEPGRSSAVFDHLGDKAAALSGVGSSAMVLNGGHDSTLADVPVLAAVRKAMGDREFIHFQAGSWGMARLIGGSGPAAPPEQGFGKNVMFQGDLDGNPVLTASAPTGIEFQHYAGDGPAGKGEFLRELGLDSLPLGAFDVEGLKRVVSERAVFVTPGLAAGIGPYPGSVSLVHGAEEILSDRSGQLAYVALNLETAIMAAASVELVSPDEAESALVLSAGAIADPLFRLLLATLMPAREVYYVAGADGEPMTETTCDGGFLLAVEHATGTPAYDSDISGLGYSLRRVEALNGLVEDLAAYRQEFERRASA